LDQGDVIGRSHGREEGKADGDRASVGAVPDEPPTGLENTVGVGLWAAAVMCSFL
jgi:hypothetical protein